MVQVALTFLDLSNALSTDGSSPDGAFWLYAAVCAAGWGWLYAVMPETRGRSLEQIERLFDPRARREGRAEGAREHGDGDYEHAASGGGSGGGRDPLS